MEIYYLGFALSLMYMYYLYDYMRARIPESTEDWLLITVIFACCVAWPLFFSIAALVIIRDKFKG